MNTLLAFAIYALTATKTLAADYVLGASDVRAERQFSLNDRYPDPWVSNVFKYNILLTLSYLDGNGQNPEKAGTHSFTLQPGEVFAFHKEVLPEYKGKVVKTMNADFMSDMGFKSDGWLIGDGVCHLASMLYWTALDAGLTAVAPTNHDFANIPEVPKKYGVSIFYGNAEQNLYITNTMDKPVTFAFVFDGTNLTVKVSD